MSWLNIWPFKEKEKPIPERFRIFEEVRRKGSTFKIYEWQGYGYGYRTHRDTLEEARKVVHDWIEDRKDALLIKEIEHKP